MIDLPSCGGGPAYKHTDLTESQCMQLNISHSEAVRTRQMLRLEGRGMEEGMGAQRSLCTYPGGGKGKREKERIFPKSDGSNGDEIGQNFGNRKESLERI